MSISQFHPNAMSELQITETRNANMCAICLCWDNINTGRGRIIQELTNLSTEFGKPNFIENQIINLKISNYHAVYYIKQNQNPKHDSAANLLKLHQAALLHIY